MVEDQPSCKGKGKVQVKVQAQAQVQMQVQVQVQLQLQAQVRIGTDRLLQRAGKSSPGCRRASKDLLPREPVRTGKARETRACGKGCQERSWMCWSCLSRIEHPSKGVCNSARVVVAFRLLADPRRVQVEYYQLSWAEPGKTPSQELLMFHEFLSGHRRLKYHLAPRSMQS